jgi:hypothetical protein
MTVIIIGRRELLAALGAAAAWLDLRRCACCRLLLMGFELATAQAEPPAAGWARPRVVRGGRVIPVHRLLTTCE